MIQVGQYLLDHPGILDAGDDPDRPTTGRACSSGTSLCPTASRQRAAVQIGCPADLSMSMPNTRFRRCAQLMAARRCAGASSTPASVDSGLLALPRFAGVTTARCLLFGANTRWKRARFTRGLGTSAASRAMKSSGSTKSPGAILNSRRLARRAEGRMPGVTSHAWWRPGKAS